MRVRSRIASFTIWFSRCNGLNPSAAARWMMNHLLSVKARYDVSQAR